MTKFFARWPSGREVVFRSLTWAEFEKYSQALKYRRPMEVYADIYRAVVLEGPSVYDVTAGVVDYIGKALIEANPFSGKYENIKYALEFKRAELRNDYLTSARAVVATMFNKSFDEIRSWDAETFFEYIAAAEYVSNKPLEPGNPDAQKPAKKPQRQPNPVQPVVDEQNLPVHTEPKPVEDPAPKLRPRRPLTMAQQIAMDRARQQN